MAEVAHKTQLQHLAWRAGFGETLPLSQTGKAEGEKKL